MRHIVNNTTLKHNGYDIREVQSMRHIVNNTTLKPQMPLLAIDGDKCYI